MKIKAQEPINKTAALVTQESSKHNQFDAEADLSYRTGDKFWKSPIKGVEYTGSKNRDLTGVKLFRSTVINYLGAGKYQLRCVCGNYYARKTKKLMQKNPVNGLCGECVRRYDLMRHNDYLKRGFNKHDINWYILNR